MKILSMTATFGKLEHAALHFKPGMNIIHAPNEWGKSTWCAFLMAMLYGLDTKARSGKNNFADKEHYRPWSGSPMSGRMEVDWNGRRITIERRSSGRIPMGEFRAYETESGLTVPELTADNCGKLLLGEGQNVVRRGGFISLSDLPVTEDETFRSRLNALVTTADESGDAEKLGKGLRELKNRIRYNKSGLLPELNGELADLDDKIGELSALGESLQSMQKKCADMETKIHILKNHQAHLEYQRAQQDSERIARAEEELRDARQRLESQQEICRNFPPESTVCEILQELEKMASEDGQLELRENLHYLQPQPPSAPAAFRDLSGDEAVARARKDSESCRTANGGVRLFLIAGILLTVGGIAGAFALKSGWPMAIALAGVVLAVFGLTLLNRISSITRQYTTDDYRFWVSQAEKYAAGLREYQIELRKYRKDMDEIAEARARLDERRQELCGEKSLRDGILIWNQRLYHWSTYEDAARDVQRAEENLKSVTAMASTADAPTEPDTLDWSAADTLGQISELKLQLLPYHVRIGECRGRMEQLGDYEALVRQRKALQSRIAALNDYLAATELAQQTLTRASGELQRRFAPRLSKRAQELLREMTDGRYDRLSLAEDLSLRAGAAEEDTMHSVRWRSAGTADQIYLALRLAVSEALTPDAPLILDDALARCDDSRMCAVLKVLEEMSESRQIILFSCQRRESLAAQGNIQ